MNTRLEVEHPVTEHANNVVEARFLRMLTDRDLNCIFVYSIHPNHRNRTLDIYR